MKTIITVTSFIDAFNKSRPNDFSYQGLKALFSYLENLEQDSGSEIELDVIALCCEYTEYEDLEDYNNNYKLVKSITEIEELTTVIRIDGTERFIIQDY